MPNKNTFDIYNPATGRYWRAKKGDLTVVDAEEGLLAYKNTVILIPFGERTIKQLKEEGYISANNGAGNKPAGWPKPKKRKKVLSR